MLRSIACNPALSLVAVAAARTGLVHDEAHGLALLDVVKGNHADKAVGVLRAASLNFVQNFASGARVKQRQLPHGPVVGLRIRRFVELNTGKVALLKYVSNLTLDLGVAQGGQVRQSFVTAFLG